MEANMNLSPITFPSGPHDSSLSEPWFYHLQNEHDETRLRAVVSVGWVNTHHCRACHMGSSTSGYPSPSEPNIPGKPRFRHTHTHTSFQDFFPPYLGLTHPLGPVPTARTNPSLKIPAQLSPSLHFSCRHGLGFPLSPHVP